jgi:hypothetical protein
MHFQIMMKEGIKKCIFKVNHIFRISVLLLHVSALHTYEVAYAKRSIRTISSGPFGLPEDGASAAPKHVGARVIF